MRLFKTEVFPIINRFFYIDYKEQASTSDFSEKEPSFHSHPELQLTFIKEGVGKRIVGNTSSYFSSGDMAFLGSDVPHIWIGNNNQSQMSSTNFEVVTVYFHPNAIQNLLSILGEFENIQNLLNDARKGIFIYGDAKISIEKSLFLILKEKNGFEKLVEILKILNTIEKTSQKRIIANSFLESEFNVELKRDWLPKVLGYLKKNFSEDISLNQVASIAHMSKTHFSKSFKNRMKMTFSNYLISLRLNKALKLIIQTENGIAEIAYDCGFNSDSYFCKVFKEHFNKSPLQYKKELNDGV